jgi:hypothetical protein
MEIPAISDQGFGGNVAEGFVLVKFRGWFWLSLFGVGISQGGVEADFFAFAAVAGVFVCGHYSASSLSDSV